MDQLGDYRVSPGKMRLSRRALEGSTSLVTAAIQLVL